MNDDPSDFEGALIRAGRRALVELPDAPEWRVLQAEAIWRPLPAQSPSRLRQLLAVLSFDSWTSAQPALRSAAAPGARQLLFTAEGRDIDLRITPAAHTWVIEGQVLGPDESATVELVLDAATPSGEVTLDEFGSFRFEGLPPGPARLFLRFADGQVELPPLGLGSEQPDG